MPSAPPPLCHKDCDPHECGHPEALSKWWARQSEEIDDLLLRSNIHSCRRPVAGTDLSKPQQPGARLRPKIRGCLRKDGTCSARFPREVRLGTEVDPDDGSIHMRKLEASMNTITPDLTYCLRCNTDVTSLLSGTSIKAVVAYISDYVTKPSLKLYHMFDSVRAVLDKKTVDIQSTVKSKENCRVLLMQMVNSLTSKLQIGSPMAALYLLDNPDHYTNCTFKLCWWRSYVAAVKKSWEPIVSDFDMQADNVQGVAEFPVENPDRVVVMESSGHYVGATNVDDYMFRSAALDNCSVFKYVQMATRVPRSPTQIQNFEDSLSEAIAHETPDQVDVDDSWLEKDIPNDAVLEAEDDQSVHAFLKKHPLWKTHYVKCDRRNLEHVVPNFVGGSLPRMDQGDREAYCCTMLTLFKPWRTGSDLKSGTESWAEAFNSHKFSRMSQTLMKNFNVRYECNDARDDFASQDEQTGERCLRSVQMATWTRTCRPSKETMERQTIVKSASRAPHRRLGPSTWQSKLSCPKPNPS
ncbi:hypothetical protein K438DRAFT_1646889 [Mycena galopus ATCC 62051]|nr:hypothetical protein K438DRAFT_1646889 [Mycena galopus ATCC 62051]